MEKLYLHQQTQYLTTANIDEKALKLELKQRFQILSRRTTRLTLLALLGALPMHKIQKNCGVYITSSFSSPRNMYDLQLDVFQHKTPRPFQFINSINNAVSFYIAQALNLKGPNLFIATQSDNWSQIFLPALIDLTQGKVQQALVGWCYESPPYIDSYHQEGSHWLLLSRQHEQAIAEISIHQGQYNASEIQKPNYYYQNISEILDAIQQRSNKQWKINLMFNKYLKLCLLN